MRDLTVNEIEFVAGNGEFANVVAAGAAGAAASTAVAVFAGTFTMGAGAAAVFLGGFAGGVALYYLTD